jgi:hypothetical protein
MKKPIRVPALLLVTAALVLLATIGLSSKPLLPARAVAQKERPAEDTQLRHEQGRPVSRRIQTIPRIVSATPTLKVVHTEIVSRGSGDHLRLNLHNGSPKAIISFTICTLLDEQGSTSITYYGPEDGEALSEVIAPYGDKAIEISAGNIKPGEPLTLCAATFMDETQEGLKRIREIDKKSLEEAKSRRRKP